MIIVHRRLNGTRAGCQAPKGCGMLLLLLIAGLPGQAQEYEPVVQDFAGTIEAALDKLDGNTIVAPPLPYADGIPSIEGALLMERLVARFSEQGVVRVVDRASLDKIMEEQKLSASGFVDPAASVRIGQLLGAKGIISGSVTDMGENVEIHARLVSVETGAVVASFERNFAKAIKTFISPLWTQMNQIRRNNPSFGLKIWMETPGEQTGVLRRQVGDFLVLQFQAERDCYLTLFDFTTSGSVHVLFPNGFMPDNHIKAGRVYRFPDPQAGFKIRVKDPPGIERVKAFATARKTPLFEHDFSVEKFRSLTEQSHAASRDIEMILDEATENAWAEADLEIRVDPLMR